MKNKNERDKREREKMESRTAFGIEIIVTAMTILSSINLCIVHILRG